MPGGEFVTDVATRQEADGPSEPTTPIDSVDAVGTDAQGEVQWAPAEPAKKKRHLALWIGIPVGLAVAGLAAASAVLIAPGTTVAGVPVGLMTTGAATEAIQDQLDATVVTVGDSGATMSAADLGATIDSEALATAAFANHPAWNPTQWFADPTTVAITVDSEKATEALRAADPSLFVEPVGATISFDGTSYVVAPAVDGAGINTDTVSADMEKAFNAGKTSVVVDPTPTAIPATTTTDMANGTVTVLNGMLDKAGFYVGDENTVPLGRDVVASWITVGNDAAGAFTIAADAAKIQPVVDTLPGLVDQAPVNGKVITNDSGSVLRTITATKEGRTVGATAGIATAFATQLASGNAAYALPVEVVPTSTVATAYLLEVDLSEQRLYAKENGATVFSWPVSTGLPGSTATHEGHFTVNSHILSQTMKSYSATDPNWNYDVPNVQWVMYFNGNQAFHGVYWHNNFGRPSSHGCVGMSNANAKTIYDWAPTGTDVWIHG